MEYQNGKIYKIFSDECYEIYIGSTCRELNQRFNEHKYDYKQWTQGNEKFIFSFPFFQICNDAKIELIEAYPCNSKEELHARERYWIEQNEGICINKHIPGRTRKEYYDDNKDKIIEYQQQYREDNKAQINEQAKQYYQDNKQLINEKQNIKFNCECGGSYSKRCKIKHQQTIKHQQFLQLQQPII